MTFIVDAVRGLTQKAEDKAERVADRVGPKVEKAVERGNLFVNIFNPIGTAAGYISSAVDHLKSSPGADSSSSTWGKGPVGDGIAVVGMTGVGLGVLANAWGVKESAEKAHRAVKGDDIESFGYHAALQIPIAAAGVVSGSVKLTNQAMIAATGAGSAALPIVGAAGLLAQSTFNLVSSTYVAVSTHFFENELAGRAQHVPSKASRSALVQQQDPRQVLFELAFGKKPAEDESPEQLGKRLQEQRDSLIRVAGEESYKKIVKYFGVSLDAQGLPENFNLIRHPLSISEDVKETREFVLNAYDEKSIKPAADWLFEKAFGKELVREEGRPPITDEDRILQYKIHRERFIRLTSETCYEDVAKALGVELDEEGIPKIKDGSLAPVEDVWRSSINRELISEVFRACFQKKAVQILKIFVSILCITAAIALLVGTGGVGLMAAAAILLAITAICQIFIRTEQIQEKIGKWIWERFEDRLSPMVIKD